MVAIKFDFGSMWRQKSTFYRVTLQHVADDIKMCGTRKITWKKRENKATCSPVPCIAQFGVLVLNCSIFKSSPGVISISITRKFVPPKSIARNLPSSEMKMCRSTFFYLAFSFALSLHLSFCKISVNAYMELLIHYNFQPVCRVWKWLRC